MVHLLVGSAERGFWCCKRVGGACEMWWILSVSRFVQDGLREEIIMLTQRFHHNFHYGLVRWKWCDKLWSRDSHQNVIEVGRNWYTYFSGTEKMNPRRNTFCEANYKYILLFV